MSKKSSIEIRNRRASFDYEWIEQMTAGIVLQGTEVKALRDGQASLSDTFCFFHNGELWVKNMHIAEYRFGTYANHHAKRDRKLLLHKRELRRLQRKFNEKGLTIVVTRVFFSANSFVKVNIALARGKREYDKRETIKEKDMLRASQYKDY